MRIITLAFLTLLSLGQVFGQTDKNGNPVFNSVSTNEKVIGDFLLISNYYTLKNNIENSQSSVFISEKPTLDQVEKAATNLASDFYILTKESKMVYPPHQPHRLTQQNFIYMLWEQPPNLV